MVPGATPAQVGKRHTEASMQAAAIVNLEAGQGEGAVFSELASRLRRLQELFLWQHNVFTCAVRRHN